MQMKSEKKWKFTNFDHAISFVLLIYFARYRQFAKLLSRLVRHSVQYVSDMHSLFRFVINFILIDLNDKQINVSANLQIGKFNER